MESEVNLLPTLNDISKMEINNISKFYSNQKENKKLLTTFKSFSTKYFEALNGFYKQITEINCHFLVEDKFKPSFAKTPMFQLGKSLKNILESQINNYFTIITDDNIFNGFNNVISYLSNISNETAIKFDKKTIGQNARNISNSLCQKYEEIESKIIDDYIFKKYNKHLAGINNESLGNVIDEAKYLERTFSEFEEATNNQFFYDLNEMENKIVNLFEKMKKTIGIIIETLKNKCSIFLKQLENEINFIKKVHLEKEEELKKEDDKEISQSDKDLELKNIFDVNKFKYKIKILSQPIITTEPEKKKKGKEKKETKKEEDKEAKDTDNENKIILTEEDIYNIISTLYTYEFKMINKEDYDLKIEKGKLEIIEVSNNLLSFDADNNINEKITDKEVDKLYELLKNKFNLKKFFMLLNNYRASGKINMTERAYNIIKKIFIMCQDYLLKERDKDLEELVIILSQTFFMLKNGEKIYLQIAIKDHQLYKKIEFWKIHLDDIIEREINRIEKDEKEGRIVFAKEVKEKKIKELVFTKIIPFSTYMREFDATKECILGIINPVMDKFNLDETSKMMCLSMLENK